MSRESGMFSPVFGTQNLRQKNGKFGVSLDNPYLNK